MSVPAQSREQLREFVHSPLYPQVVFGHRETVRNRERGGQSMQDEEKGGGGRVYITCNVTIYTSNVTIYIYIYIYVVGTFISDSMLMLLVCNEYIYIYILYI